MASSKIRLNNGLTIDEFYVSEQYWSEKVLNVPWTAGAIWGSGNNTYYNLGKFGSSVSSPIQVGTLTNWQNIACGNNHVLAINTGKALYSWGGDTYGETGQGSTGNKSTPTQVGTLNNWKELAAGSRMSAAIKTDGTLWTWGYNPYGQLGHGGTINKSSPTQVGTLTNWKTVSMGYRSTGAIKTDGTLWAWGVNNNGQLGDGTTIPKSSPIQIGSLTTWSSISCGYGHNAAIKTDGSLWICGYNNKGQLGLGTVNVNVSSLTQVGTLTNWKQVSCGYANTAAVKTDGTLWVWGSNASGQLGDGTTISKSSPIQVGSLTDWKSIVVAKSSPNSSMIGLKTDGTIWGWGMTALGELGLNTTTNVLSPTQIGTLNTWKQVSMGYVFSMAIK